jgi:hypothetical protein
VDAYFTAEPALDSGVDFIFALPHPAKIFGMEAVSGGPA